MTRGRHRRGSAGRITTVAASWLVAAVVLACAVAVDELAPDGDDRHPPFVHHGAVGSAVAGRDLRVTVATVTLAERVRVPREGELTTGGRWVVVEAEAEVLAEPVTIRTAELMLGDLTYTATERAGFALLTDAVVQPGLGRRGYLAFEIPAEADTGSGILALARSGDTRLDSVLSVPVDLAAARSVEEFAIEAPAITVSR